MYLEPMNTQARQLAAWTVREVVAQLSSLGIEPGWCAVDTDPCGVRLHIDYSRLDPDKLPSVVDVRFNHAHGEV